MKIRPTILLVVFFLGVGGIIGLLPSINAIEVSTGCFGLMAGLATRLVEDDG